MDGTALKMPELTTSTSNGRISAVHTGLEDSDCITPSKRKRKMADGSDSSGVNASKDVCTVVDTGLALPSGCTGNVSVETCGICFKRQRYSLYSIIILYLKVQNMITLIQNLSCLVRSLLSLTRFELFCFG